MAKLKKCKACGKDIATSAKICPHCGKKNGLPGLVKVIIILVFIFGCIVACMNGCANSVNEAIDETKNSYKDINGKTSFKVNETFQNSYEKITMTEANTNFTEYGKYSEPSTGKKYVMVKFEVENINKDNDELYVSTMSFNGFADGVAVDQKYYVGNDVYDNEDLSATVTYGKKTIGYIFYEVPVNTQKFTIDYNASFWTDGTKIEFIVQ